MRKVAIIAVGALLIAIGAGALYLFDQQRLRQLIVAEVNRATGGQLVVGSRVSVRLGAHTAVELGEVVFVAPGADDATSSKRPVSISAGYATVKVAIGSLLSGSPAIESVALRDVVVDLPQNAAPDAGGTVNYDMLGQRISRVIEVVSQIRKVTISNLLMRRPGSEGSTELFGLEQLQIAPSAASKSPGLAIALRARLATQPLALSGVLALSEDPRAVELSNVSLNAAPVVSTGAMTVRFDESKLRANVAFDEVIVEPSGAGSAEDDSANADIRSVSLRLPTPVTPELMIDLIADVTISTLRLHSGGEQFVFRDAAAHWVDGRLAIRVPAVDVAGGQGLIEWMGRPAQPLPRQKLVVDLHGVDSARLNRFLRRPPLLHTQFRLQADLEGPGASVGAWLANAKGHIRWLSGEGRFAEQLRDLVKIVDSAVGGVTSLADAAADDERSLGEVSCTAANFAIGAGVAKAEVLVAQTKHAVIRGSGTVALTDGTLALKLVPQPKSATLNVGVPVRLTGSLAAPAVTPDEMGVVKRVGAVVGLVLFPSAGIAALSSLGSDAESCVATLGSSSTPGNRAAREDTSSEKSVGGKKSIGTTIGEATDSAIEEAGRVGDKIGGAINRLFGN